MTSVPAVFVPPQMAALAPPAGSEEEPEIVVSPSFNVPPPEEEIQVEASTTQVVTAKPDESVLTTNTGADTASLSSSASFTPPSPDTDIGLICEELRAALDDEEPNLERLVPLMAPLSPETRNKVLDHMGKNFPDLDIGVKIRHWVNGERIFPTLALLLMRPPIADAYILALRRREQIVRDDLVLWTLLLMKRTSQEWFEVVEEYKKQSTKPQLSLPDFDGVGLGGSVQHLLTLFLEQQEGSGTRYNPDVHTPAKARQDAERIYKKGSGRNKLRHPRVNGKLQKEILDILVRSPPEHLRSMDQNYAEQYGITLKECLEKIFKHGWGELLHATLFWWNSQLNPVEAAVDLFRMYVKCAIPFSSSRDNPFLAWLIIRHQAQMVEIDRAYQTKYGKGLSEALEADELNFSGEKGDLKKKAYLMLLDVALHGDGASVVDSVLNPIFLHDSQSRSLSSTSSPKESNSATFAGELAAEVVGAVTDSVVEGAIGFIFGD